MPQAPIGWLLIQANQNFMLLTSFQKKLVRVDEQRVDLPKETQPNQSLQYATKRLGL